MMRPRLTVEQQLHEVEDLIEAFRWSRDTGEPAEQTYRALKQIAADLRGRMAPSVVSTVVELQRRIDAAARAKTALGYEIKHLVALGQEMIGRWSVIRRALERFAADQEAESRMPSPTDLPF